MHGTPWSYGRRNWIQLRRGGKDQGSATSCANQYCSRPIIRSSRAFPTDGTYFRFTRRLDGCISVRATLWHGPGTGIVLLRAVSIHRVSQKVGRTVRTFLTGGSRRQLRAGLQIITRSQIHQSWGIWGFAEHRMYSRQRPERGLTKMDIIYP
jgi:hypothetical protein